MSYVRRQRTKALLPSAALDPNSARRFQSWKAFLTPKLRRVVEFLTSQGITMAGNLLYGFLCVRLLPIPDYAKYTVVFGFLATLSLLMDIGFSNTLLPLIGQRTDDRRLIADYVASLRQLAHWLFLAVAPAAIVVYPIIVRRQHWSLPVVAAMIAILLAAAWCARVGAAYGAVLIVRRDRKAWYRVQMTSSLGTLALLGVAWITHLLSGFCAMSINVVGMAYVATAYFLRARHLLGVRGVASREKQREIAHFVAPNLPGLIFYAFVGQISLFLITFFGRASAVASVGALTRLGQIFGLLGQMTPLLIEPYFAKLPAERVRRNYVGLIVVEVLVCGTVTGLARLFPGLFLWILGHKYSGLRYEVFLMMAIASLAYLSGVLWVVHNARLFVYWWGSISAIIWTIAIQILCIWKTDLSTIRGVLMMNLWTCCGTLAITIVIGFYGFRFGPRRKAEIPAIVSETGYA
jgi:O-antigen/teichoic acid export membrane protein